MKVSQLFLPFLGAMVFGSMPTVSQADSVSATAALTSPAQNSSYTIPAGAPGANVTITSTNQTITIQAQYASYLNVSWRMWVGADTGNPWLSDSADAQIVTTDQTGFWTKSANGTGILSAQQGLPAGSHSAVAHSEINVPAIGLTSTEAVRSITVVH